MSAILSDCGTYRYALWRDVAPLDGKGMVLFVMLNPSTADASEDDPTIRRCMGFAKRWGFRWLGVGNLYGYRATSPRQLLDHPYPVVVGEGPLNTGSGSCYVYDNLNDEWLRRLALKADRVIAAWGATEGPLHATRCRIVRDLLGAHFGPHEALALTKQGHPRHPLYVRSDVEPIHFEMAPP